MGLLAAIVRGGTSALEKYNSRMSDTCAARNSKAFAWIHIYVLLLCSSSSSIIVISLTLSSMFFRYWWLRLRDMFNITKSWHCQSWVLVSSFVCLHERTCSSIFLEANFNGHILGTREQIWSIFPKFLKKEIGAQGAPRIIVILWLEWMRLWIWKLMFYCHNS